MRLSLLTAFTVCMFSFASVPSLAQDAFAGADNSEIYAPHLHGVTTGIGDFGGRGPDPDARQYAAEDLKKLTLSLSRMEEALKAGDLNRYASLAYKVNALTGLSEYQLLADVAMNDVDFEEVDGTCLLTHLEELKRILYLLGKSPRYVENVLVKIGGHDSEVQANLGREKVESAALGAKDLQQLEKAGLRKFSGQELLVAFPADEDSKSQMVRRCAKRTLAQIVGATRGNLSVKYVDKSSANLFIGTERKESLWYSYQNHATATLLEPSDGVGINSISMKVPLLATMHRKISESECQDWCNVEISKALGYAWSPVSRERFLHDFPELASKNKGAKPQSSWSRSDYDFASPAEHQRLSFRNAITASNQSDFAFYAGWVYLDSGNVSMARRYFCTATEHLLQEQADLHALVTRLLNAGQANSAELIVFACINDDINNDENSQATIEYERVKKQALSDAQSAPPPINNGDLKMLSKIYAPPSTPAERISAKES